MPEVVGGGFEVPVEEVGCCWWGGHDFFFGFDGFGYAVFGCWLRIVAKMAICEKWLERRSIEDLVRGW